MTATGVSLDTYQQIIHKQPMIVRPHRLLSACVCLLFFGGIQVASFHRATELHGYCSQHGVLIHLGHQGQTERLWPRNVAPEPTAILLPDVQFQDVHDCIELAFLGQSSEFHDGAMRRHGERALTLEPRQTARPSCCAIPLLSQAPKSSPPSIGSYTIAR
jgi:hypothetical protein